MIRNLHWYSSNETRAYPVADGASCLTVDGRRLPPGIIADLHLRYPEQLGPYPFLAAVSVTEGLVSLTIQAAAAQSGPPTFAPVAVCSVPVDELEVWRHYPLEGQVPGAGGWVVFGHDTDEPWSGRFEGPDATLLCPRAARPYRPLPVASLSKLHADTGLTGIVSLHGDPPVRVVREEREILGVVRDVIVVRLEQPGDDAAGNVFEQFAGPCGHRPESGNCVGPVPAESLNAVQPDCYGNITIEFAGCAVIASVIQQCGVMLDCALGLSGACRPSTLPGPDGRLNTDYEDQCAPTDSDSVSAGPGPGPGPEPGPLSEYPSESLLGALPYSETYDDGVAQDWIVAEGAFTFVDADGPGDPGPPPSKSYSTETAEGTAGRNLAVWNGFDEAPLGRKYTTEFKMLAGPANARHNGGLVLNRRLSLTQSGRSLYYLAEVDYDAQRMAVRRFNGTQFVLEAWADLTGSLALDRWYRMTATVTPATGQDVTLTVTLDALEGPALTVTLGPMNSGRYLPASGRSGVHADRAHTRFSFWKAEEVP